MPKVLLLSLVFGPDTVSTANMMTDLAQGLARRGHEVTVLTSMPHYNPSREVMENPRFRAKPPTLLTETDEGGVRVLRVYMPLKRRHVWLRALDFLWFHLLTTIVALLKIGHQDVILVTSPPITLGLSGYLLAMLLRGRLIYDVRELWPDVPVRMGLLKNRLLVRLVYGVESLVYRKSSAITSIARCFNDSLVKRGVPKGKLRFTPNFVDVKWIQPLPKANAFALEHGLVDKFVVFYAGNIGLTQGLEVLVEVGQALRNDTETVIVVVGNGAGRPKFEQAVRDAGLQNVRLLPFQPYARVPETYATADVCISPMRFGFSYDTVPSKIYTALAAARPVVAACELDTESARLLTESNSGFVVQPESAEEMVEKIRRLQASPDLARTMGQNGRRWIVDHYSKDAVVATYHQVVCEVAKGRRA